MPLKIKVQPYYDTSTDTYPDTQASYLKRTSEIKLPGASHFFEKVGLNKCQQEQHETIAEMTLDPYDSLILPEMLGAKQIFQEIGKEIGGHDGVSGLREDHGSEEGAETT